MRLEADGQVIDTGANWGLASPAIEDIDRDGLPDLLLGDFRGKFRVWKNIGMPGDPRYTDAGLLQAGDEDAAVRIYCCVVSQARFADPDGDGLRDLVSNSYDPGHVYLFRGIAEGGIAAREELVDSAGVPIRTKPEQRKNYESFGSFAKPVDWDGDGDFDLLLGTFQGELLLRRNEGTAAEWSFAPQNEPRLALPARVSSARSLTPSRET